MQIVPTINADSLVIRVSNRVRLGGRWQATARRHMHSPHRRDPWPMPAARVDPAVPSPTVIRCRRRFGSGNPIRPDTRTLRPWAVRLCHRWPRATDGPPITAHSVHSGYHKHTDCGGFDRRPI